MEWLIPICVYWPTTALYLGGMGAEVEGGGGPRQVSGLLLSFVVFMLLWRGLSALLGSIGPVLGALVLPTAVTVATLPVVIWLGYRVVGLSVRQRAGQAH